MMSATEKNGILQRWREVTCQLGDETAIFDIEGSPLRTFRDLAKEAALWEEKLAEIPVGTVVAMHIGNRPEFFPLLLALFQKDLVPLPMGQTHPEERDRILDGLGVRFVAEERPGRHVEITHRVAPASNTLLPTTAFLKLTSGTTGHPRAIEFTADQLLADCDNVCDTMGIRETDINLGVIPVSHSYGFSNLVTPLLCRGVPLVLSADRIPRAIVHALRSGRATVFPGMPLFFQAIAELAPLDRLPELRLCISAGAPLAPEVAERFQQRLGLPIHVFYGSSECGGIAYDREGVLRRGYVGQPLRRVRVEPTEDGGIEVSGAAVGSRYFPCDEPLTLGNHRFRPADLVEFDGDSLRIVGRRSDLINVAGRKLNPLEIEQILQQCPGVREAIVFGVPSLIRGEEAVACISGDTDSETSRRFAAERLSGWQMPKDFWIVPELPVNERGKISRGTLAALYLRARALAPN